MDASNQPLPEVRDAAPTYPNEQPPSTMPLPRSSRPRPADAGSLSKSAGAAPSAAPVVQPSPPKRADAMAAQRAPAVGAAPVRNPDDWIKAIDKLRREGKSEQAAKELVEFRRAYPLHPLPNDLQALVPK